MAQSAFRGTYSAFAAEDSTQSVVCLVRNSWKKPHRRHLHFGSLSAVDRHDLAVAQGFYIAHWGLAETVVLALA